MRHYPDPLLALLSAALLACACGYGQEEQARDELRRTCSMAAAEKAAREVHHALRGYDLGRHR